MNLQNIEYASKITQEQTPGFLIIIARLGNLETQKELSDRRLYNVRLKLTLLGVPSDKIVVAEGERLRGFGRVEFYLRGQLIGALPVPKGSDICVGCCDPDERFYPYKRKGSGVKRNKAKVNVPDQESQSWKAKAGVRPAILQFLTPENC